MSHFHSCDCSRHRRPGLSRSAPVGMPQLGVRMTVPSWDAIGLPRSGATVEMALDHGRVTPRGNQSSPAHANALLTILPGKTGSRDRLIQHLKAGKAATNEDPALPLHADPSGGHCAAPSRAVGREDEVSSRRPLRV